MDDRIADVWGPRTPYAPSPRRRGRERLLAGARVDQYLMSGVTTEDVDRWVQTASVLHSNGDAYDFAVRDGRDRRRAWPRPRSGQPGAARPEGPVRLAGQRLADRLDAAARPRRRRLVETDWDDAMGAIVDARAGAARRARRVGTHRLLHRGQLALEDYYTLGVIGKAGIGTPHMDGNTRLCTATAATALKVSFGTDGQPGSYADVDHCDAIALWGHNVAETQTVLWARMLDRRAGAEPAAAAGRRSPSHAGRTRGRRPPRRRATAPTWR